MLVSVSAVTKEDRAKRAKLRDELNAASMYRLHTPAGRDGFIRALNKNISGIKSTRRKDDAGSEHSKVVDFTIDRNKELLRLAESGAPESKVLQTYIDFTRKSMDMFRHGNNEASAAYDLIRKLKAALVKVAPLEKELGIGKRYASNDTEVKPKEQTSADRKSVRPAAKKEKPAAKKAKPAGKLKRTPQLLATAVKASPAIRAKIKKIDDEVKKLRKELILAYRKRLKDKGKK